MILLTRSLLFLAAAWLTAAPVRGAAAVFFEPDTQNGFVARAAGGRVGIDAQGLTLDGIRLSWRSRGAGVSGELPLPGVSNYFIGNDPSRWRTAVPRFGRVRVHAGGPAGPVVTGYPRGRDIELDFEIPPGARPDSAGIDFPESVAIKLESSAIVMEAGTRRYRLNAPVTYQEADGKRTVLKGRFVLDGPHRVSFSIGAYDHARTLVIDPVLEWLTYYGGSGEDHITAIVTDSAGNVYLAGGTTSTNLPWAPGGFEPANPGTASYLTKLDPTGSTVLFSTFLGSETSLNPSNLDSITRIAFDPIGNIYVCGYTEGTTFPVTAGVVQPQYTAGFAAKLDPSGGQLLYATFLGAPGAYVNPTGLAVDANGNAFVGGTITGPQFIGTGGAFQTQFAGGPSDGVILALNSSATALRFGTLLGGSDRDVVNELALDSSGNIVVAGETYSADFPVTSSSSAFISGGSGFVSVIDPTGSSLIWSKYIAGSSPNGFYGVNGMLIAGNDLKICGYSPDALSGMGFPVTSQPAIPASIVRNGFIAAMNVSNGSPEWVSQVPGSCNALAADAGGFLFMPIAGVSSTAGYILGLESGGAMAPTSPDIAMYSPDASQLLYLSGLANAFVFTPNGTSTNLTSISARPGGELLFAGFTPSLNLATTAGVLQPSPDPAPRPARQFPLPNPDDGFAGALDLSAFRTGNFLAALSLQSSYTLRIGDPSTVLGTIPVVETGSIVLQASANVPWLDVSIVPGGVQIQANSQLTAGNNIPVQITLSAAGIPGSSVVISTQITVLARPTFTLDTTPLAVSVYSGLTVDPIPTRNITYDFGGLSNSFQTSSSAPTWLFPFMNSSPGPSTGMAQLSINFGPLPVGTYSATVTVSLVNVPNSSQTLSVTYTVLPAPTMTLTATSVTMRAILGQPASTFTIGVSSSVPNFPVTTFLGSAPIWFTAVVSGQTAPCQVLLTASPPPATAPGIYYFNISIGLKGQQQTLIEGSIEVASSTGLSVIPSTIAYTYYRGAASNAPFPEIELVAPQTMSVNVAGDQPWFAFKSIGVQTPSSFPIQLGPFTMPEGTYSGNLRFTDSTGKLLQSIPVTLNVYDVPVLTFNSSPMSFQYNQGDPTPAAQTFSITTPTLLPGYFSVEANQYPAWVSATPSFGRTPAQIAVTVDPTGLAPGVYQQNLVVAPMGSIPSTTGGGSISVTLTVSSPAHPLITAIVSAASALPGPVAPGELVLIYGYGLGGSSLSSAQVQSGALPVEWNGTSVTFDEFQAPIQFTSGGVVGVSVPFEISGRSAVEVAASYQGNHGLALSTSVSSASPGVFTADESGSGQAIAFSVNPDGSFQANSANHPVMRGGLLVLYITGCGVMNPAAADGSIASMLSPPQLSVTALVGSQPAKVAYAGSALGILSGVLQVNLVIPDSITPGASVPIVVLAGASSSQPGITIAVQ